MELACAAASLEWLRLELMDIEKYQFGKCGNVLIEAVGLTYAEAASILASVSSDQPINKNLRAVGLWAHARASIPPKPLPDGRHLSEMELYLESVACDNSFSPSYNNLATLPISSVVLIGGQTLTKRQLHMKSIQCDRSNYTAYCNLGLCLDNEKETISLDETGSQRLNRRQLFLQALNCNDRICHSYLCLAWDAGPTETIQLLDGRRFSKQDLQIEAVICQPNNEDAVLRLKSHMDSKFSQTLNWDRRKHVIFPMKTNILFGTFFLALQRLEDTGVLPLAHQAMLEDVLEGWTWLDSCP